MRALYSWVRTKDISVGQVLSTILVKNIFDGLSSQYCFEISCDLICEIVFLATRTPRDMALIEHMYNLLIPMKDVLSSSLDDAFRVRDLSRVFVEAGESFVDLIVSTPEHFEKLLDGIMICSDYDFLDVIQNTCNFWHTLTDELLLHPEALKSPIFFSLYDRLTAIIIKNLEYPSDLETFTATEKDEIKEFRYFSLVYGLGTPWEMF